MIFGLRKTKSGGGMAAHENSAFVGHGGILQMARRMLDCGLAVNAAFHIQQE
jgi:hypothetical protein